MKSLSQAQFEAAQSVIDNAMRGSKRGTPERAAAEAISEEWESAIGLPQSTFSQREVRLATIAAVAVKHGWVKS